MEGEPQNLAGNRATSPLPTDVVAQEALSARMMAGWDMHPTFLSDAELLGVHRARMIDRCLPLRLPTKTRAARKSWDPDALLEAPDVSFLPFLRTTSSCAPQSLGSTICTTRRSLRAKRRIT